MSESRSQWIKRAGLKSRKALVWLRDHRLPADPICYAVAYEYLHSQAPQLKEQVDTQDINATNYLEKIHAVYYQCIKPEEFKRLAMSSDICNQYVCEILQLLLKSGDKINQNDEILDAINQQINCNSASQSSSEETEGVELSVEGAPSENDYLALAETTSLDKPTKALDYNGLTACFNVAAKNDELFPMAILRLNIDRFRPFNDSNGQFMGDAVLKSLVKTAKSQLKGSDLISRYESDEFIIMLPNTDIQNGVKVADNLRHRISTLVLKKKNSSVALKYTISVGVSALTKAENYQASLDKSKIALARSKDLGRNCVNRDD